MFLTDYIYYWFPFSAIEITDCPSTKRERERKRPQNNSHAHIISFTDAVTWMKNNKQERGHI